MDDPAETSKNAAKATCVLDAAGIGWLADRRPVAPTAG